MSAVDVAHARQLRVQHRTVYRYQSPVARSAHTLRLVPMHDHLQQLLHHELRITIDGQPINASDGLSIPGVTFDDVFGNRTQRIQIGRPYSELVIDALSTVVVHHNNSQLVNPLNPPPYIPWMWMPWQRQVLEPFLLLPELPESELNTLLQYATQFVQRNNADLVQTMLDINATIFREYAYRPGFTTVTTSPFEAFVSKQGVCQDFTNIFICLARLLGVPARYMCGYVYTGPKHENRVQSEASHAWVQLYLPDVGWRGFDPTNGVVTHTDHVRVALGRNYVDATPTSGTIYGSGAGEMLDVQVTVESIALP